MLGRVRCGAMTTLDRARDRHEHTQHNHFYDAEIIRVRAEVWQTVA